jgi:hypothetical protein
MVQASQWSGVPRSHGEHLKVLQYCYFMVTKQFLRYQEGKDYNKEEDYTDPSKYNVHKANGGLRVAGVMVRGNSRVKLMKSVF